MQEFRALLHSYLAGWECFTEPGAVVDGVSGPGIDSYRTLDVDLKAVSGVVPIIDPKQPQPAPCAVVHSPIDHHLSLGLFVKCVVPFGVVSDAVAGLFRKRIARPTFADVFGPGVPEHVGIIDLESGGHGTEVIYVLAEIELELPAVSINCIRDLLAGIVAMIMSVGDAVDRRPRIVGNTGE